MKKMIVVLCILVFPSIGLAGNPYPRQPTGYQGIEWGTDYNSIASRFTFLETRGNIEVYTENGNPQVEYLFKDGKLNSVFIKYSSDLDTFIEQMHILYLKHGPGDIIVREDNWGNESIESIDWFGDITTIILPKYTYGKPVIVYMASTHRE